ncbi:uncharacterized protein [Miscanthus floridulus]|uniref:uncharacterized protein isoform X3 n=1 Tax=Miscanthus floridulus TaxID=154761 RepID=UPI00345AD0E1
MVVYTCKRKVIHTVGPKYAVKYHTAAENALSHCYRSCLELLIENGLESIAMGCIYTEAKNYPREPASHVAIRQAAFLMENLDKSQQIFVLSIPNEPLPVLHLDFHHRGGANVS